MECREEAVCERGEREHGINDMLKEQVQLSVDCINIADSIKAVLMNDSDDHKFPDANCMMDAMKLHTEQLAILRDHLILISRALGV